MENMQDPQQDRREVWRQRRREWIEKAHREGHCVHCSNPIAKGRTRCAFHLEREKEWRAPRPIRLCGECGQPMVGEETYRRRVHPECREVRKQNRDTEYRKTSQYAERHRAAVVNYQERHQEQGLCLLCSRKAVRRGLCRRDLKATTERDKIRKAA